MNKLDEHFYAVAAGELATGGIASGVLAKAYSECEGNEQKAKARYIQLRAEQLKSEFLLNVAEKEKKKEQARLEEKKIEKQKSLDQTFAKIEKGIDMAAQTFWGVVAVFFTLFTLGTYFISIFSIVNRGIEYISGPLVTSILATLVTLLPLKLWKKKKTENKKKYLR